MDLLHFLKFYPDTGKPIDNETMYRRFGDAAAIDKTELETLTPVGRDGRRYSLPKRRARWMQQELKRLGLLERVGRAQWKLTEQGRKKVRLTQTIGDFSMLAFSTRLGIAVWGDARAVFDKIDTPITLMVSSPPYPIMYGRAYGKWGEDEVIDLIVAVVEKILKNLVDGGSVMLNVGVDVFEKGKASRSVWVERLILRIYDVLGLRLMDRIIWHNPSKIPGPVEWASKRRIQMSSAYEPVLWFSNNPNKSKTDNRRILTPYTDKQKKLIERGGEAQGRQNGDGAYTSRRGAFGKDNGGSMPRNIFKRGHISRSSSRYRSLCKENGLPTHHAMFPFELAEHLVKFGSEEGDLVVDPFGGSLTTAAVCEENRRRFITTDVVHEYLHGGGLRLGADMEVDFLNVTV